MIDAAEKLLSGHGIRITPNRLLVTAALLDSECPLSLSELETKLDTIDKSSIFRVVTLLLARHVVHSVEDGEGTVKYESCADADDCAGHMHAHFYCHKCHRTFCLPESAVPPVATPEGFILESVNYMAKGICSECAAESATK